MLNIIIPMAGEGRRFLEAGYTDPKPFILVNKKMMIEIVIENCLLPGAKLTLIVQKKHLVENSSKIDYLVKKYSCNIIVANGLTEGSACTLLLSSWIFNNNDSLLILNSDQYVDYNIQDFIDNANVRDLDGSILTFKSTAAKWSYAELDSRTNLVKRVVEKIVISEYATIGIYYYKHGSTFINSVCQMIANRDKCNNEYYTAPAYNYAIRSGLKIGLHNIDLSLVYGLGTPEDLELFLTKKGFRDE